MVGQLASHPGTVVMFQLALEQLASPPPPQHTHLLHSCQVFGQDIIHIVQIWWSGPHIPSSLLWRPLGPYVNCPPPSLTLMSHCYTRHLVHFSVSLEYQQLWLGGGGGGGLYPWYSLPPSCTWYILFSWVQFRLVWFGKSCLWECGYQ